MKKLVIAACLALGATVAVAAEHGSAAEARAMLEKAVAAISTDKATALGQIARGEAGFKDRDLYPFCGGPDGNFTAHPSLTGKSMKGLVDKAGEPVGQKLYAAAAEGSISEVGYMWPRPGSQDPVQKVSFVTRVGDQVCAVGYYK
ncbi:MAG: cache domain-containing protein [Rhodocyclaceae bacterium]|nr:cache domain-containing protein [Gammaproteobacteria bacterium]MCB1889934.1 cache domain-containing protein [Rhodocyclaceae bacterium]